MRFQILLVIYLSTFFLSCNNTIKEDGNAKQQQVTPPEAIQPDSIVLDHNTITPYVMIDKSPMDMIYYPADFPKLKMADSTLTTPYARIIYSRPRKQGRVIFGGLLKYGEPWRLGANEATEVEFFKPATIQNKRIDAGRYIIYCIPSEKEWEIILNKNLYSWGLKLDSAEDLAKFKISVKSTPGSMEYFTMSFENADKGTRLVIAWDNAVAELPITF